MTSALMAGVFALSLVVPAHAQNVINLPDPGQMVNLSALSLPPILKGVKVYADNPFQFEFVLNNGDSKDFSEDFKRQSARLISYFLAALTVPAKDLWVNLSPYEKDRIITNELGQTEMGRDLLAQDYILKQITASVIYPESETGKSFWEKVYSEAQKRYGTIDIPVDTFNKVWIVPEKAVVFENPSPKTGEATAFVLESRLKVMLDSDYVALRENVAVVEGQSSEQDMAKDMLRAVIVPVLEKEVNEGKNFSALRQVYNSLILAAWYKNKIKASLLSSVYVDQKKVVGVDINDKKTSEKIWDQYVQAFKKGVYNYIKDEYNPLTQETIPRKYFSGGVVLGESINQVLSINIDAAMLPVDGVGMSRAKIQLDPIQETSRTQDAAQNVEELRQHLMKEISDETCRQSALNLLSVLEQFNIVDDVEAWRAFFDTIRNSDKDAVYKERVYRELLSPLFRQFDATRNKVIFDLQFLKEIAQDFSPVSWSLLPSFARMNIINKKNIEDYKTLLRTVEGLSRVNYEQANILIQNLLQAGFVNSANLQSVAMLLKKCDLPQDEMSMAQWGGTYGSLNALLLTVIINRKGHDKWKVDVDVLIAVLDKEKTEAPFVFRILGNLFETVLRENLNTVVINFSLLSAIVRKSTGKLSKVFPVLIGVARDIKNIENDQPSQLIDGEDVPEWRVIAEAAGEVYPDLRALAEKVTAGEASPRVVLLRLVSDGREDVPASLAIQYTYSLKGGMPGEVSAVGEKAYHLMKLNQIGLPVPSGFSVAPRLYREYIKEHREIPADVWGQEIWPRIVALEISSGRKLGDAKMPLLLSIRSNAEDEESMAGLLESITNIGLNDQTVNGLATIIGKERAYEEYAAFIRNYAVVVLGIDKTLFEEANNGPRDLVSFYKDIVARHNVTVPSDVKEQLRQALPVILGKIDDPLIRRFREANNLPVTSGMGAIVQEMVFGHSFIYSSRNVNTGEKGMDGAYVKDAPGDVIVSGATGHQIFSMESLKTEKKGLSGIYDLLVKANEQVEDGYRRVMTFEGVITAKGELYFTQVKPAEMSARGYLVAGSDFLREGKIPPDELLYFQEKAIKMLGEKILFKVRGDAKAELVAQAGQGVPGAQSGRLYIGLESARKAAEGGEKVVLLVHEGYKDSNIISVLLNPNVVAFISDYGHQSTHLSDHLRGFSMPGLFGISRDINVKEGTLVVVDGDNKQLLVPQEENILEQDRVIANMTDGLNAETFRQIEKETLEQWLVKSYEEVLEEYFRLTEERTRLVKLGQEGTRAFVINNKVRDTLHQAILITKGAEAGKSKDVVNKEMQEWIDQKVLASMLSNNGVEAGGHVLVPLRGFVTIQERDDHPVEPSEPKMARNRAWAERMVARQYPGGKLVEQQNDVMAMPHEGGGMEHRYQFFWVRLSKDGLDSKVLRTAQISKLIIDSLNSFKHEDQKTGYLDDIVNGKEGLKSFFPWLQSSVEISVDYQKLFLAMDINTSNDVVRVEMTAEGVVVRKWRKSESIQSSTEVGRLYDGGIIEVGTWRKLVLSPSLWKILREQGAAEVFVKSDISVMLEENGKRSKADNAMVNNAGGIDLNNVAKNVQMVGSGDSFVFDMDPAVIASFSEVTGFKPVVIDVKPLDSLHGFLGVGALPLKQ